MAREVLYDPDTGRFLNQDTYLGNSSAPPSLHRYLYAYSNPALYTDPDGHRVCADNEVGFGCDAGTGFQAKRRGEKVRTVGGDLAGDADRQRVNNRQQNTKEAIDKYSCKDGASCPLISTGDPDRDAAIKAAAEQSATTGGSLTREGSNISGDNEIADEINSSRERVTNTLKNMDRTLQSAAGFHPAVGAFDTIQGAKKAVAFMRDNPGTSTAVAIAAGCALIPKCRNAAKATGGKTWNSVKNASSRSKSSKGKNHNRDSAATDDETGFDPNYGKDSRLEYPSKGSSAYPQGDSNTYSRVNPKNLKEKMIKEDLIKYPNQPGSVHLLTNTRPPWKGWHKMEYKADGVTVHYNYDSRTGKVADFKYVQERSKTAPQLEHIDRKHSKGLDPAFHLEGKNAKMLK
ncbi:MAG: hypothetical protein COA38_19815 [Fluviicola sp.]|nr:MAG: hypothetical protein COA38_19815 [Fluviicola sp.]